MENTVALFRRETILVAMRVSAEIVSLNALVGDNRGDRLHDLFLCLGPAVLKPVTLCLEGCESYVNHLLFAPRWQRIVSPGVVNATLPAMQQSRRTGLPPVAPPVATFIAQSREWILRSKMPGFWAGRGGSGPRLR